MSVAPASALWLIDSDVLSAICAIHPRPRSSWKAESSPSLCGLPEGIQAEPFAQVCAPFQPEG
jgi:hypothetical protein